MSMDIDIHRFSNVELECIEEVGYYSTDPYLMHSSDKVCSILTQIKCYQWCLQSHEVSLHHG